MNYKPTIFCLLSAALAGACSTDNLPVDRSQDIAFQEVGSAVFFASEVEYYNTRSQYYGIHPFPEAAGVLLALNVNGQRLAEAGIPSHRNCYHYEDGEVTPPEVHYDIFVRPRETDGSLSKPIAVEEVPPYTKPSVAHETVCPEGYRISKLAHGIYNVLLRSSEGVVDDFDDHLSFDFEKKDVQFTVVDSTFTIEDTTEDLAYFSKETMLLPGQQCFLYITIDGGDGPQAQTLIHSQLNPYDSLLESATDCGATIKSEHFSPLLTTSQELRLCVDSIPQPDQGNDGLCSREEAVAIATMNMKFVD